jgi:hypothetical protein
MSERTPSLEVPKSEELLEALLTIPGSTGETYRRFHPYSPRNLGFLAMQGCPPEPVATYARWTELGRQVLKGSKAFSILRPIQVRVEGENEEDDKLIRRFKVVRALFPLSQTAGEELPPYEPPAWSVDRALGELAITRVPFASFNGNTQGYSYDRNVAVSPVAVYPFKTLLHEVGHVVGGHTTPAGLEEYGQHRGRMEFEAEATAFLTLKELGATGQFNEEVMRGYVQNHLGSERPPEQSFKTVLNSTTTILNAGYEPAKEEVAA